MNRTEKQEAVDVLTKDMEALSAVFAVDFRGLKVGEATELRRKVRESGSRYRVVKNTLALRTLKGTPLEPMAVHFRGMTGLAYTSSDPVALAKVLNDFAKDVPVLIFKGGMVSGKAVTPDQCKQLAALPGKDELRAKLLYVLQATIQNFLGVLQAPVRDFMLVLKAAESKAPAKPAKESKAPDEGKAESKQTAEAAATEGAEPAETAEESSDQTEETKD
ncbi:MAG: 50S ribosomal protein L10 [Vicinamibacteria bacterium]